MQKIGSFSSLGTKPVQDKGGTPFEPLMWPFFVVIFNKLADTISKFPHIICRVDVDILLLDGAPKAFYPNIVLTSATPVHTYLDGVAIQQFGPFLTCVLDTLVGVDDFRTSVFTYTFREKFCTIPRGEGIAEFPTKYATTVNVNDCIQVHKSVRHAHIRDVGTPNLVGVIDVEVSKQIREDILGLATLGKAFFWINRSYIHFCHQAAYPLVIDGNTALSKQSNVRSHTCCRMFCGNLIHLVHNLYIRLRFAFGLIIQGASVYTHKFAETRPANILWTLTLNLPHLTFRPASSQALAKKSISNFCCPITFSIRSFSAFNFDISFLSFSTGVKAEDELRISSSFQLLISEGAILYSRAKSCSVLLSFNASMATFALKDASNLLRRPIINYISGAKVQKFFLILHPV